MKSILTDEQIQKIRDRIAATKEIPTGLGDEEAASSIASINLALTGQLTDDIPACMSPVIGRWIIRVQDRMPYEIRNGALRVDCVGGTRAPHITVRQWLPLPPAPVPPAESESGGEREQP